jgi:hypothetical protein
MLALMKKRRLIEDVSNANVSLSEINYHSNGSSTSTSSRDAL